MTTGQRKSRITNVSHQWNVGLTWIRFTHVNQKTGIYYTAQYYKTNSLYFYLLKHRAQEIFNHITKKELSKLLRCRKILVLMTRTFQKCPQAKVGIIIDSFKDWRIPLSLGFSSGAWFLRQKGLFAWLWLFVDTRLISHSTWVFGKAIIGCNNNSIHTRLSR